MDAIRTLAETDLTATDDFIYNELLSDIPLINKLTKHILASGGKRIRPLLTLITARACGHHKNQHIKLAAAIELIHTATLLHDDVVDTSELRRGKKTAHKIWGNEASVLVGDFLYSRSFQLLVQLGYPSILSIFANATNVIAEGEVMQLINRNNPYINEETYFETIQRKTARLFAIAAESAAILGSNDTITASAMQKYGMHLGTAYQLIDDLLDYNSTSSQMGKNPGDDIGEGKVTLPLIHAIKYSNESTANYLREIIKTEKNYPLDKIKEIITKTGAIEYTIDVAKKQAKLAITSLEAIPQSTYRDALKQLAEFIISRNK